MILSRRHVMALAAALPVCAGLPARAETAHVYAPGGVAIGGFDPVAYFTEGRAVAGSDAYMLKWRGAIWLFASAENREAFEMDPAAYAPQYGGYCAFAVSNGTTAASDPRAFAIRDGRLFLNHDQGILQTWQSDAEDNISRADLAWPGLEKR